MHPKTACVLCGVVFGIYCQAVAMDGFAVTNSRAREDNLGDWLNGPAGVGHIVKHTIANNIVTRTDTIYNDYWGGYCIINVQGNKIAFLRENVNGGTDNWKVNANRQYITVMNADGSNARDLDTLLSYDANTRAEIKIAWPAGDYIYYHYNIYFSYGPESWQSNGNPRSQIWRVKYNDPSTQQLVYTYKSARTFSMSLDATRASITTDLGCAGKSAPFCNIPHWFPPVSEPDAGSWDQGLVLGCGSYLSPSGKHHWHFWEGGHTDNRIETIDLPNQVSATVTINFSTIADWVVAASPDISRNDIVGGNMDWGRWSANSDKWLCGIGNNSIGAKNQILWNWIDHQAINTSRHSVAIDGFVPGSECGALWVAGGPGGDSYEDVSGRWVNLDGAAAQLPHDRLRMNRGKLVSSREVNVYTVQGRLQGPLRQPTICGALPVGAYFVSAAAGPGNGTATIEIFGNEVR